MLALLYLAARALCRSRLQAHGVVNPLGVVGDDSVNSRLFDLATLLSSVGSDAHCNAVVEQRTSRVTLKDNKHASRKGLKQEATVFKRASDKVKW